jgi:hypothetical protein
MVFGPGPGREWAEDAVNQFQPFTDLHATARAHEPADAFDKKIALPVAAELRPGALYLVAVAKRIHDFHKHDANIGERKITHFVYMYAAR